MTIKEFADLCACNTQTLRYYDRIGLLRPHQVDPRSRYRYYEKKQAVDFIKIKNLQLADFSIEEIKTLLKQGDEEIYHAFDQKIKEQQKTLERIKKIQQSYLREKNSMEQLIQSVTDFLLNQITDFEGLKEFGLDPSEGEAIIALVRTHFQKNLFKTPRTPEDVILKIGENMVQGADQAVKMIKTLDPDHLEEEILLGLTTEEDEQPEEFETIWEYHDWKHIYDFFDQIPPLEKESEYQVLFPVGKEETGDCDVPFSTAIFMIGALLKKNGECNGLKGCKCLASEDGKNHFALQRKKE